jgi:hypothetical protein
LEQTLRPRFRPDGPDGRGHPRPGRRLARQGRVPEPVVSAVGRVSGAGRRPLRCPETHARPRATGSPPAAACSSWSTATGPIPRPDEPVPTGPGGDPVSGSGRRPSRRRPRSSPPRKVGTAHRRASRRSRRPGAANPVQPRSRPARRRSPRHRGHAPSPSSSVVFGLLGGIRAPRRNTPPRPGRIMASGSQLFACKQDCSAPKSPKSCALPLLNRILQLCSLLNAPRPESSHFTLISRCWIRI